MKRLWLAGGILATVVLLCISSLWYQHQKIDGLLHQLDAVDAAYDETNTAKAYTLALTLSECYERDTVLFPCFMSHTDLIGCRESVVLLPSILKDGNAEEFHMESARCRAQLERLIQVEIPTWQNIF